MSETGLRVRELRIDIPNGRMTVHTEEFFEKARISPIRKMLKLLYASSQPRERLKEVRTWLDEQIAETNERQGYYARSYVNEKSTLSELEETYRQISCTKLMQMGGVVPIV